MNGALVPDASAEFDGEVRLRSGAAAFAASGELVAGPPLKNGGPWFSALGGAFLMTSSGRGLVASAGASPQMSGGPGIVATDGAPRQRNDGPGHGAPHGASPQKNGGAGVSCPDGFGRYPQRIDLVGWGGLLVGVTAGAEMGPNGTDVGGDDSGGPVAAVLGASCTEDG